MWGNYLRLIQVLERELLEARGQEGKKVKEKFFTEATKLVFTIYFRILKSFPRSNLMGQSLFYIRLHCSGI
jgi:nucleolar complex protein 3